MEELQTTAADETTHVYPESGTEDAGNAEIQDVKGIDKKNRKELFQINTHPASVISANNRRDQRLKQIVMRVVAFCKKEHEEGQQIPFRFFKKRASLMTGVSLSTIHRIETIDMKAPPSPEPESCPGKVKAKKDGQKKAKKKKKKESCEEAVHVSAAPATVFQHRTQVDSSLNNHHIHFQVPAVPNVDPAAVGKPAKKRKKKVKSEEVFTAGVTHNYSHNTMTPNHSNNTTTIITSDLALQPTAMHTVSTVGEGVVTTINVHNAVGNAATQQRAPCTWTAGHIGPFTMGELRDGHQVQLPAASHLQVNAQHVQAVGSAIPVGAQLQPISVAAAVSQQAAFAGQIDGGNVNWAAGTMGAFGTLQTTATLVGQQVVQTYPNNPATGHVVTANTQQHPQQSPVFYQF